MADELGRKVEEEEAAEAVVMVKPPPAMMTASAKAGTLETTALPLGMVLVQVFTSAMLLLSKVALNTGMRPFVLIAYRNLIAAAAVAPLALIFERGTWKKLNLVARGWLSVNATLGVVLAMGLYYYGLRATSPAYSVNFLNLIPIVTFIIAIVLRAEKLTLRKWPGRMKLLGTAICVGGTMVVTLVKGQRLHLWPTHLLKSSNAQPSLASSSTSVHHDMVAGTVLLCASCLCYALWFIVQVRLAKVFPSKYWATTLTCLLGSLQSFVVGAFLARDPAEWKLKWDFQLLTVVYSGVFTSGITFVLISWAISKRGPIYPPMFNSLSLIITTVMDSLLLGTNIYVGSVLGTLLIILGLYAFLWGKGKELMQQAVATATAQKQAGHSHLHESQQQQRQGGNDMA
ncbi:hypothetical protein QOZ80_5AG0402870 [Eleusine coracana subsp. coracana]|nr:hypothetical protein QOZ80_5AG0402870 [Eleusine coracana subsp. coracana]